MTNFRIMKAMFFVCCLFINTAVLAETPDKRAELEAHLSASSLKGNERLETLAKLVRICWRNCPNKAIEYTQQAEQLLKEFPNPKLEAQLYAFIVRVYIARGDYETAQKLTEKGIEAGRRSGDEGELSRVLFNQAVIYSNNEQYILAENIYKELLEIYTRANNKSGMASTFNNLGFINHQKRNIGLALEYYQKALPLYEEIGSKPNQANTLVNIADLYRNLDENEQGLKTAKLALEILNEIKAPRVKINALQTIARIYIELKRYDEVIENLILAEGLAEELKMRPTLISIYSDLSRVNVYKGDIEQAKSYNNTAKNTLDEKVPDKYHWQVATEGARIAIYEKNWQLAENLLAPVLKNKDQSLFLDRNLDSFGLMVELQEKQGNWQKSAELNKTFLELYDDYFQLTRKSQLEQFAALYQKSEKEKQIANLEQQNSAQKLQVLKEQENNRLVLYISTVIFFVLLSIVVIVIQRRKVLKMEAQMLKENIERSNRMFSDISHELRTPLTVIKLKIQELEHQLADNPQQTYDVMNQKLAGFNLLIEDISLLAKADSGELKMVLEPVMLIPFFKSCKAELESLAKSYNHNVVTKMDFAASDSAMIDEKRIHQVMTNLFSNSCKYTTDPGSIYFSATIQGSKLKMTLEDSKPSLTNSQLARMFERLYRADESRSSATGGSGLGLAICRRLITLHNGTIEASHSEHGGVCITIIIPIEK